MNALLLKPLNGEGVYLVRRDEDPQSDNYILHVKHNNRIVQYTIISSATGHFSVDIPDDDILYQHIFNSVEELLLHYSEKKEDICTKLDKPCVYASEWEIKTDEVELASRVASGDQVEVWKGVCGVHAIQGKRFKCLDQPKEEIIEEVEVMKQLNQQNIVKFHGILVERASITIITECLNWKTLAEHHSNDQISRLPVNVTISILRQVLNGLAHLQEMNIVHLSFSARSVLYCEKPSLVCKITNFSLAKRIHVSNKITEIEELKVRWLPPEIFQAQYIHINCDVWSFGIFIHELHTRCELPFPGMSDSQVATQVRGGYQMECPTGCPLQLHAIARECWNLAPEGRPTFKSLQPRLRELAATMTIDGRPIPAQRRGLQKHEKPIPKPRKKAQSPALREDYVNTTILNIPPKRENESSESAPTPLEKPRTKSVVPLLSTLPPPLPKRSQNSELQIKRKELKLISKIRNHLQDEVWEGVWKENKHVLVILQQIEVLEQIDIMKTLKHDNVLKLIGLCTIQNPVYLLTEVMRSGTLLTFLKGNKGALEDQSLLEMAIDIARGMAYLHSHFVIHRDLRADTVLMDENNTCKIAHFNYVKRVDKDTHTYTALGTERVAVKWAAPETLLSGVFSTRSDVWSFGIILYEIVTYGTMPYPGMKNVDTVKRVAEGYRMPCPDSTYCPEEVYYIMLKCWDQKPDLRPSSIVLPQTLLDLTENQDDFSFEEENNAYIDAFDNASSSATSWNIEPSDLTFVSTLAHGASGEIWQGTLKNDTPVAIKCIDVDLYKGETQQRVETLKQLKHSYILELHGVSTAKNITYVITELMQQGNLRDFLQNNASTLTGQNLVSMSWQIANGMAYLEEKRIIHGNLSAVKVLVRKESGEKFICKISGMFGTEHDKVSVELTLSISPKWMAPETALESIYQQESDIWAFGVVLYEIMTYGLEPFLGMKDEEVVDSIVRGYRMPCPEQCREDVYMLMLHCWNEDPSMRPPFELIASKLGDVEVYEENEIKSGIFKEYADLPLESDDSATEEEEIEVKLELKIAEPASGDIWRGSWSGIPVAVKYPKRTREILQSFELMKKLNNPNILQVLVFFSKKKYIVMEYMCRGNLQDYIAWEGTFLAMEKQIEIATQCARGMLYLENQKIIHGNLTARNVLVGDSLVCKITGVLGKGMKRDAYSGNKTFPIPYKWMALETLLYEIFSTKSDTWSFGILLYEIMTHGNVPYPKWETVEAVGKIKQGYRMPRPRDCPSKLYRLMRECWDENPSKRPPFSQIERTLEDMTAYVSMPVQEEWSWNIHASDLSRGPKVADSNSGEIHSGVLRGKIKVTVLCPTRNSVESEIRVAELMKSLKHPHILSVLGVCSVQDSVWICTEVMVNGNLKNFIKREQKALSVHELVQFSAQCASGMLYLEERDIVHGNLTSQQVLVGDDLKCKITGISGGGIAHDDPSGAATYFLPVKYRAPETLGYDEFTPATDVWSFGIVLYEILSYGRDPYSSMSNTTASIEIQRGHRMECPPNAPREVGSLLLDCWAKIPELRPKFDNVTLRLHTTLNFMSECNTDQTVTAAETWEVKETDMRFEEKLKSGKSGDIWKGVLKETKPVAIQISVKKDEEWLKAMMKLDHPNILGIEAVCYTPEGTLILTELMENDNLVTFLRSGGRSLKKLQLIHIALQISHGMVYLKNQEIVHRDLCARNVLVGEKTTCKITGILGDWADAVDNPYYEENVYTPPVKWAAPEAVLFGNFTYQSDIWSFGIALYEIVTYGRFPYPGMTRHEVISKIQEGYRMPPPESCPSTLYEIMEKCWQEQPEDRYTPEQLNNKLLKYHEDSSKELDKDEVSETDVKPMKKIGESAIGEQLWEGQFHQRAVLIKYYLRSEPLGDFLHEVEVLQTLSHEHVIAFLGLCPKGKTKFIVLESVKSHNLLQCIQTLPSPLRHTEVFDMALQVASGMAHLHMQGVVHRYLSASNIMIGDDNKCKIANFQQALLRKQGISLPGKKIEGNVRWMAIEVLSNDQYSTMSDVWSYGIFLYELATQGQTPYSELTNGLVCHKVPDGHRISAPPACPPGLYNIMYSCWNENPRHRPTFNVLKGSIESLMTQEKAWETRENEVVKKGNLGTGSQVKYTDLWKCTWKQTNAVVRYHKPVSCSYEEFLWGSDILKTLKHPHVVELSAVCAESPTSFIVLEDIDEILVTILRETSLGLSQILSMTGQVAEGMAYLEEHKIIHRDLTARSILVKDKKLCKISNFSKAIIEGRKLTQVQRDSKLPVKWSSPESALSKLFSTKSDVWSFGVLLYEAFTRGMVPYADIKDTKTLFNKLNAGNRLPCPDSCPPNVHSVMLDCWNENPKQRPTFHITCSKLKNIQDNLKWEIDVKEITIVKDISSVHIGQVWEGRYKQKPVTVKYYQTDDFLWEAELLKALNHPHIIKLIGLNMSIKKGFIVTTYTKNGTLLAYLKKFERLLTMQELMMMGEQVADGMSYLQTQSVIHRDLGARSVLVGENNACIISGLGRAIYTAETHNPDYNDRDFPIKWLPPEAITDQIFNMHTDIWSYGILLHEIVTFGDPPYKHITETEALRRVKEGYRMPIPENCPEDVYNVMTQCWREIPSTRPSFETVRFKLQIICQAYKRAPASHSRTLAPYDNKKARRRSWTTVGADVWEVERSLVTLNSKHGEGRFGEVWKGYLRGSELVAIKTPKLDQTSVSDFLHEAEVMKLIRHSNVVSLKGVCTQGTQLLIITEFMSHGSLVKYLRTPSGRQTTLPQLLTWATQVCNGMTHLEECKIIHRDVAARNVLMGEELVCKISDFGLAQKVSGDTYKESSRTQFPIKWMAPEAIRQRLFSVKSDVWAFGILLYEMVTHGAFPYPGVQNRDVAQLVKAGYRMPCPRGCPRGLFDIMDSCWKEKPEERPSFSEICTALSSLKLK